MAKITIGAAEYEVALPNFKTLKAAWRHIAAVQASDDPMDGVDAILGIVSVGATPAVTVDELEEQLRPDQMVSLRPFVNALMVECGLADPAGEGDPQGGADPSTGTSTA